LSDEWKIVKCKWIFKIKYDEKEQVVKFKARLVIQKFSQIYKINYQKMFTSIIHRDLLRMFLVLMTSYNLKLHQMNVKVVYLLRDLKSEKKSIYMHILKNVTVKQSDKMMCQIVKELYELKQSAQLWYKKLIDIMKNKEFQNMNTDSSIQIMKNHNKIIIISVYVNNLLITNKIMQKINCMKIVLNEVFKMLNLNKAQIIVDFQIIRDKSKWTLTLNQVSYIMKVLSEEEMQNCSAVKVLMKSELYVTLDKLDNAMKVSTVNLQWIVEKLMYIACKTWSDIIFVIECLSQNFINVRTEYIKVTK